MTNQQRFTVVVVEPGYATYDIEREILADYLADFLVVPLGAGHDEKVAMLRKADAVMVREAVLNRELIDEMEKCKVIVRYGIGVDNIDLQAARSRQIYVANVPQYGADEVSCHAVALLFAVARWVAKRDRDVRQGSWGIGDSEPIHSFRGMGLGIVGFGSIARSFLEKMQPFGFKDVWVFDPQLSKEQIWAFGAHKATIEEICAHAEVISLHAPLVEGTKHIIGAHELSLMSPKTILINTARGPLIDERALVAALQNGTIKGAGIDVFETEPPDTTNPLFKLDNVVVSDHTAWYSESSIEELQTKAAREVYRVFSGEQPASWLNSW